MLLSFALVSIGPLFESGGLPLAQWVPRAIIVSVYLLVALDLQVRGERREHLVVLLAPLLSVASLQTAPLTSDVASGLTVGALALSAARQLRPRSYLAVMIPAGVAHATARVLVGGPADDAIADVVVGIGTTYAVYAFAAALQRAAERSVMADAETARQRRAAAREEAQRRAVAAAEQALHDEVLVALRAVGDASVGRERVRHVCGRAVEAVAEIETLVPWGDAVADAAVDTRDRSVRDLTAAVVEDVAVSVSVVVDPAAADVVLPGHVHDAVVRAVREALRNVARHSGSRVADLVLDVSGGTLRVSVVDRGVGMPEEVEAGFGTTRSIVDPVVAVGGSADLRPTPGGGTTVDVRVPVGQPSASSALGRAYDLTVRATGTASPIHAITWPVTLVWVYTAVRYSAAWPTPWVSLLLAVVYVASTTAVILRITRQGPSLRWLLVAALGLLALNALSLELAPPGSLLDYRSWTMGFLAAPLVALTMILPTRVAVAVLVPHPILIVLAASAHADLTGGAIPWGSLNAVLATPVAAIVLGRLLRRIGRRIGEEESETARLSAERARQRSVAAVRTLHLDHTLQRVLPWLREIRDGAVDPQSSTAAEQAALLSSDVRDDLYAPGFLHGEIRRQVTDFRRDGGRLTLRPGFPPGASAQPVHDVLRRLFEVLGPHHRITVTPQDRMTEGVGRVRFAIVPSAPAALRDALPHCVVDTDPFRTVITLTTAPSAAGLIA